MQPLKMISFAAPGLDEAMELYPTYLSWKDKKKDAPNQTETQKYYANMDFYGKILTTYAPLAATMVATTLFLSQSGQDFFTNGMSAVDLATHFNQSVIDYKLNAGQDMLSNAVLLGGEFVDFVMDASKEVMQNVNGHAYAMAATIYASSKVIAETIKNPYEFILKADRKRESYKLESEVLNFLKLKDSNPVLEKYNDFELFSFAHRFNDSLFEIHDKHPTLKNRIKHKLTSFATNVMECLADHDSQELKEMIKNNNDVDLIKSILSEDQSEKLFPSNENGQHRETLYKINSDALKLANRTKMEDEFILGVALMTQGKGQLKDNLGAAKRVFDKMKKNYNNPDDFKQLKTIETLLNCIDPITKELRQDADYQKSIDDLIESVPHLLNIERKGARTILNVNKIKIEDYYQSAFEEELKGKITDNKLLSLRKNYKKIDNPNEHLLALEEEMKESMLFEQETIEQAKKGSGSPRVGYIGEKNDEMIFKDISGILKPKRLTNK